MLKIKSASTPLGEVAHFTRLQLKWLEEIIISVSILHKSVSSFPMMQHMVAFLIMMRPQLLSPHRTPQATISPEGD